MTAERSRPSRLKQRVAVAARWLHLYLSMVSFAAILFFAATGLTLNHADRLGGHDRVTRYAGVVPRTELAMPQQSSLEARFRREHGIRGAVTDFRSEPDQTTLSFKGPGYTADAFVDRATGRYEVVETRSGWIATVNDLHRGAATGRAWSWVIDLSAVLLVLVSLTGLLLLLFVYKRRSSGLVLAALGGLAVWAVVRFVVP